VGFSSRSRWDVADWLVLVLGMALVTPRRALGLTVALLLSAAACGGIEGVQPGASSAPPSASPRPGSLEALACSIPHEWLVRTWNGYRADRSVNLQLLPKYPNFIGSGLPHVGPWAYDQDVPMLWYGPGYIKPVGKIERPVTVADIAPTEAALLNFPFNAPDGTPMREGLVPEAQRTTPPRLIVTLVWDAAGRDVLSAWPNDWPVLKSLIPKGAWYEHATIGSSPTSTAQDHANIGTGAFPNHHGIVSMHLRIGDKIQGPYTNGPTTLILPTLADLYDRAMGNRPKVAEVASVGIHLGMLGHGAMWGGGDKDIVVLRELAGATTLGAEGGSWNLPDNLKPFYRFPSYVRDLPPLSHDFSTADASDGTMDGLWRGMQIDQQKGGFDTPARIPNEERVIETIMQREGFGKDDVPDLFFINYKLIDEVGHIWNMNSLEMHDSLHVQDEYLGKFIDFLNSWVGRDKWVLLVTADHGSVPDPKITGAFQISAGAVASAIESKFDNDSDGVKVVEQIYQTGAFINQAELIQNGYTMSDLARFVMTLTQSQTAGQGVSIRPGHEGDKVFQAAFPSSIMRTLPCLPEARA
jgi:hypothetical protein